MAVSQVVKHAPPNNKNNSDQRFQISDEGFFGDSEPADHEEVGEGGAWFLKLLDAVEQRYGKHPYHSFRHAVDVTHAMFLLLEACEAKAFLDELDILALMIAALFHDIDHPGLNNGFLVKTSDPLAIRYNLRSGVLPTHAVTDGFQGAEASGGGWGARSRLVGQPMAVCR
eukprot:267835-Prorocentrum_minimum.AAC.2